MQYSVTSHDRARSQIRVNAPTQNTERTAPVVMQHCRSRQSVPGPPSHDLIKISELLIESRDDRTKISFMCFVNYKTNDVLDISHVCFIFSPTLFASLFASRCIQDACTLSREVSVPVIRFYTKLEYFKKLQWKFSILVPNFMKIRSAVHNLLHTNGLTHNTKITEQY